jgi:hypothetical protein
MTGDIVNNDVNNVFTKRDLKIIHGQINDTSRDILFCFPPCFD